MSHFAVQKKLTQHCKSTILQKLNFKKSFVVVQSLSHVQLFANPWTVVHQASLLFYLLELAINDAIQPSHPLSSPSLRAFNLSQHLGLF